MSKDTKIQWCDSTLNLQMGCDGCELWTGDVRKCYAGNQTARYGGQKGYPESFDKPKIFPERLDEALKWKDLTGTDRPEKPWLNGLPRIIFLNDMGDTFSKHLDLMWMQPFMARMAASPHQWLVLTKRPSRFVQFSEACPLPPNVWPGTSVTSNKSLPRIAQLAKVKGGGPKFVSVEPMWEAIDFDSEPASREMKWIIFGGESGSGPDLKRCALDWIHAGLLWCCNRGVPSFVKQLGSAPIVFEDNPAHLRPLARRFDLKDGHGGDWSEWPEDLRVRQMPCETFQPALI